MPDFQAQISQRERFSEESASALERNVKVLQSALYTLVVDKVLGSLETDESGLIKFTVANINTTNRFKQVWSAHQRQTNGLLKWIVQQLVKLFDLNTAYMREVSAVTDSLEERARKKLLLSLGFDIDKKAIIQDSWLYNLAAQAEIKQRVMSRLSFAIQSKMPLDKFRKEFRDDFLDTQKGFGYLSRYFNQRTFDLFQQFDRSTQAVYREQLKLKYALYSGTIMQPTKKTKGTRPFCWQRVGNLYDLETIDSWNDDEWSGKVEGSDVKITCGGHNCRHHWSWISDEMAATLQKRQRSLNKLNPPKPIKNGQSN